MAVDVHREGDRRVAEASSVRISCGSDDELVRAAGGSAVVPPKTSVATSTSEHRNTAKNATASRLLLGNAEEPYSVDLRPHLRSAYAKAALS